jgi:hypothetical protein
MAGESARSAALALMNRKDLIDAQIQHQYSLLTMNQSTMTSPLLDPDGFPRADIDLVTVRTVRLLPFCHFVLPGLKRPLSTGPPTRHRTTK